MREDLLNELENEYAAQRRKNEETEAFRRNKIRNEYPGIDALVREREEMIFGTLHRILKQDAEKDAFPEKMETLNGKIRELLKENGFPEDYLAPVYRCAKCRDTGYTGELIREPCECMQKAYLKKLREKIGLAGQKTETFETFDENMIPDEVNPETGFTQRQQTLFVRKQCEKWADSYPKPPVRDILLNGKSGLGKTFLMRAIANRLIEHGQQVLMISAYTFLQMARKSYYEAETGVQELMEVPVLMLDDLGAEPMMQNVTVEQIFHLLNERQNRNLSTVISTNLSLEELQKRYTERIASRLCDPKQCLVLTLDGKDLRRIER